MEKNQSKPTEKLREIIKRAGLNISDVSRLLGYKSVSGFQRYVDQNEFKDGLPIEIVFRLAPLLEGRGDPPIDGLEVLALASSRGENLIKATGIYPTGMKHGLDAATDDTIPPDSPPMMPDKYSMPNDVKVFGTAAGAAGEGSIQMDMSDPIDMVRRPPGIANATDVYAIYVVGTSMFPRYNDGELVYVSERRPARQGDYVVVQVKNGVHDDVQGYVKRLVSRSSDSLVLEQLTPAATIEFENDKIVSVHRILDMNELMGI